MRSEPPPSLGIDFGGTSVKIGVCQGRSLLAKAAPIPTRDFSGPEALLPEIEKTLHSLRQEHPGIAAIGAGLPGFVNWDTGQVDALTNVEGWDGFNLREALSTSTDLPVSVDNDANAMTYAEWRFGAGEGRTHLLAMTLGTGVGGGLILGGQLYRGATYGAGEIGQISIDYQGRVGGHGNLGALERYVGNGAVTQLTRKRYEASGETLSEAEASPAHTARRAHEGDPIALALWREIGEQLAIGLSNVLWVLNLDCVVIGGGMAEAGRILFDPLKDCLARQMDPSFTDTLKIVPAHFRNNAGIIGAASLALDHAQETSAG
jgi:glucokinase